MEWVVGTFAIISIVIAVSALRKIGNMQAEISRKLEGNLRQALGALRANADENDKLLKKMSDRLLARRDATAQRGRLINRCEEIADLLQAPNPVNDSDILLNDEVLAPGYGLLNQATSDAIALAARTEALMLDPVYTGKLMAGFINRARAEPDKSMLFLHTGGTPTMFAYANDLTEALDRANA